jgi:hypothetical protein
MFSLNEVTRAVRAAHVPALVPIRAMDSDASNVCPVDAGNAANFAGHHLAQRGEEFWQQGAALAIKVCACMSVCDAM